MVRYHGSDAGTLCGQDRLLSGVETGHRVGGGKIGGYGGTAVNGGAESDGRGAGLLHRRTAARDMVRSLASAFDAWKIGTPIPCIERFHEVTERSRR